MSATRFAPIHNYRDLIVWQKAMTLAVRAYAIAGQLPRSELYGLSSQIRRAAVSVPANIAEGHGRLHRAEYRHHAGIANGSVTELETEVVLAERLGYVSGTEVAAFLEASAEVGKMLNRLVRVLGRAPLAPNP